MLSPILNTLFLTNKLEQLQFKLEKIIGIEKHAGKVRKYIYLCAIFVEYKSFDIVCMSFEFHHFGTWSGIPDP